LIVGGIDMGNIRIRPVATGWVQWIPILSEWLPLPYTATATEEFVVNAIMKQQPNVHAIQVERF
jgi:hypothetical protein